MADTVTFELPDDFLLRAREQAHGTGQPVEAVLQGWLERGAAQGETTALLPGSEYVIYTPYGNEAAAQILMEELAAIKARRAANISC